MKIIKEEADNLFCSRISDVISECFNEGDKVSLFYQKGFIMIEGKEEKKG